MLDLLDKWSLRVSAQIGFNWSYDVSVELLILFVQSN